MSLPAARAKDGRPGMPPPDARPDVDLPGPLPAGEVPSQRRGTSLATRVLLAVSSVTGGLSAALVPFIAVLLLPVSDYGAFSLVYLVYAEGWSVVLSAVCDTWARLRGAGSSAGRWADYAGALSTVCAVSAVVTLAAGWATFGAPLPAVAMAVATGATLYRQGARYHHAVARGPRAVVPSDAVSVLTFAGSLLGLRMAGEPLLTAVLCAWAASAIASAAFYLGGSLGGGGTASWCRRNAPTVRALLSESLLMDVGAAGTPLLLAPILGLHNFGIYRSMSSLSVPVQLLIDPVRPNLSQIRLRRVTGVPVVAALFAVAALFCGAVYAALTFVVPLALSFSPVLVALSRFALPCGLFLGLQFLTYVFNIFARMHVSHRRLILGRVSHTVFAISVPITGAVLGSVAGALWCYVFTTALTVLLWLGLLLLGRRGQEEPAAAQTPGDLLVEEAAAGRVQP